MLSLLPHSLALACVIPYALAAPSPVTTPLTIPLVRRTRPALSEDDVSAWLERQAISLGNKYGSGKHAQKRASGINLLTNQGADSSFYGTIAVGTPAVAFNVILDTGSSDLWLASSAASGLAGVPTFNPAGSSTFTSLNKAFSINYGSGAARGTLGTDVVQFAGFQVSQQVFAVVNQATQDLLVEPVSGLLGLGFSTISSSKSVPFWEALADSSGTLDSPVMAFQLTRFTNASNAQQLEPGGTFSLGAVDNSLFTGDIDFQPIPDGEVGYWIQQMTALSVNGQSISLPSAARDSYAAIDTGTTLVAGPPDVIAALYQAIPGSQPLTGQSEGYFAYPCDTSLTIEFKFGASQRTWAISPADFILQRISRDMCVGAFFAIDNTGSTAPPWIIGDTFLKNVYSVYRADPPAVGFATLSTKALAQNGVDADPPTATVGQVSTSITGGGRTDRSANPNGAAAYGAPWAVTLLLGFVAAAGMLW